MICMRRRPTRLDGQPAPELDKLFAHPNVTVIADKRGELEDALRALLPRRISIYADSGRQVSSVIYHEAVKGGRRYIMLANRDREAGSDLTVEFSGVAGVERWDFETGRRARLSRASEQRSDGDLADASRHGQRGLRARSESQATGPLRAASDGK